MSETKNSASGHGPCNLNFIRCREFTEEETKLFVDAWRKGGSLFIPTPHDFIANFIDPSSFISEGTQVWHFARVLAGVMIGRNCSIGSGAEIGRGCSIGDGTRISANVFLPPNSIIGEKVFIGPGAIFTDDKHPRVLEPGETYDARPPIIENSASIGAGAVILPGVRIGFNAQIAAGAIVTKDVPPHTLVCGQPARERELSSK